MVVGRVRKRRRRKKYNTEISYEIIPKKHPRLLVPVTILPSSQEHTEREEGRGGARMEEEVGVGGRSSCGPHVVGARGWLQGNAAAWSSKSAC